MVKKTKWVPGETAPPKNVPNVRLNRVEIRLDDLSGRIDVLAHRVGEVTARQNREEVISSLEAMPLIPQPKFKAGDSVRCGEELPAAWVLGMPSWDGKARQWYYFLGVGPNHGAFKLHNLFAESKLALLTLAEGYTRR